MLNVGHLRERAPAARLRMKDDRETGPDDHGQHRQAEQGGDAFWWLEFLWVPFEIIGVTVRAIAGLIASIFASA